MRTNQDLFYGSLFLLLGASAFLFAGWLHLQPQFQPSLSWFKNAESRLNHHLAGLFGTSSLAWTGHLVHVAIPEARGQHVRWNNFLTTLPHPQGLTPFFTGNWAAYAQNPDTPSHLFNTAEGAGTPTNAKFMAFRYCPSSSGDCRCFYRCWTHVPYKLRDWS